MKSCFIILFCFALNNCICQENGFKLSDMYRHWVISEKESYGDTLVFRPSDHELAAETPMYLRFGGITIFPEGQATKHRWRKCGNDEQPAEVYGNWKYTDMVIKFAFKNEQYVYKILELKSDRMKVVTKF